METQPHYLLFSESSESHQPGHWRFVLRRPDGSVRLAAGDIESGVKGERLELLTIVRGLEAIERPSRVTLLTPSSYVCEGIRYGVSEWRKNGWCWEWFGEMVPVKHRDLWQRVDRALRFHQVECRTWRIDPAHEPNGDDEKIERETAFAWGSRHGAVYAQKPWWHALNLGKLFRLKDIWRKRQPNFARRAKRAVPMSSDK